MLTIFNYILRKDTMPGEEAELYKCSFYDIIIKPKMNMINKVTETSQKIYMTSALKKALAYWKDAEPNLDKTINKIIDEMLNENKWYSTE